jgi:hypothetical protein
MSPVASLARELIENRCAVLLDSADLMRAAMALLARQFPDIAEALRGTAERAERMGGNGTEVADLAEVLGMEASNHPSNVIGQAIGELRGRQP